MGWWVEKVLPGLIDGLPYVVIGGIGLWINWRKTVQHVAKMTDRQTEELVGKLEHKEPE